MKLIKINMKESEKNRNNTKNAFTLIELLAVIIILGVLLLIAIPSVTEYINNSKKSAYIGTAKQYIAAVRTKLNSLDYQFTDAETIYYVPAKCIALEKGGKSPYGEWKESYVVVTFDGKNYKYYWTSIDTSGYAIDLTNEAELDKEDVITTLKSIDKTKVIDSKTKLGVINSGTCDNEPIITPLNENDDDDTSDIAYEDWYDGFTPTSEACFQFSEGVVTAIYQREGNIWNGEFCINGDTSIVIPKEINGVPVTSIGDNVFSSKTINQIILPNGITSIGTRAFAETKITSVRLPNSLTSIGDNAFFKTTLLTEIKFGNNLKTIGSRAFESSGIKEYNIPDSVTTISPNAFQNCQAEKVTIGSGVTTIGATAFHNCNIKNLTIKNGVKIIDSNAFQQNNLELVTIPNSVITIGNNAFKENNISILSLGNGVVTIKNSAFHTNNLATVVLPSSLTSLESASFSGNAITSYTIKYNGTNGKSRLDSLLSNAGFNPTLAIYQQD